MKKILILLFWLGAVAAFGQGQKAEKPVLTVMGTAQVSVTPDVGVLTISVSEIKPKMGDAIKTLGEATHYYVELLKRLDFQEKDIKTTSFAAAKNTVYRNNETIDSGYRASQNIRLEFVYSQPTLQKIVAELSKSEQSIDLSFSFELSETLKKKVQTRVIEIAVRDGNEKAATMAKGIKMKLVRLKSITYGVTFGRGSMEQVQRKEAYLSTAASGAGGSPSYNFIPDDLTFQDDVSMEWIIE